MDRGIWPEPIAGPDGALFEYSTPDDGIGRRLHFKKTNLPDYENPMDENRDNVYEVTVIVRDNGGATGMKKVRITVMNVDEAGKLVLSPEQPDDGMPVTATLTDPDGVEIITDWKWAETSSRGMRSRTAAYRCTPQQTSTAAVWAASYGQWWTTGTAQAWTTTRLPPWTSETTIRTPTLDEHHKFPDPS